MIGASRQTSCGQFLSLMENQGISCGERQSGLNADFQQKSARTAEKQFKPAVFEDRSAA